MSRGQCSNRNQMWQWRPHSRLWRVARPRYSHNSERFEPRWVNVVVWVIVRVCSVVLRRTVVGVDWRFDILSGSHHHLWWWLPLRLSKRQSTPTTVLFRTTLQTRTITQTTTTTTTTTFICIWFFLYKIFSQKSRSLGDSGMSWLSKNRLHPKDLPNVKCKRQLICFKHTVCF